MEISSKYSNINKEVRIPRYRNFLQNITNSNSKYRRERENILYSINNNISTSISSYDKNNDNNIYRYTGENNFIKTTNKNRSPSRIPCFCGCHLNDECIHSTNHCIPIYHHDHNHSQYSNNIQTKSEENQKNDDLFKEIIYLKRNLKRVENELNRTKTEKEASDFYIKELEKELSKLNMSNIVDSTKNSFKMRDFEKYHDMLNKSFEVLDSVSNQCSDPRGQTKGGVNYYYGKQQDYNIVIDIQKKWLDNLPNSKLNYNENMNSIPGTGSDKTRTNKFSNNGYPDDNSRLNIFKYPKDYINIKEDNSINNINEDGYDMNNNIQKKKNKYYPYNHLYNNNFDNQRKNIKDNNNIKTNNNSYPDQIKQKMNSIIMNNKNNNIYIKENSDEPKNNNSIPFPKKNNKNVKNNPKMNNENEIRKNENEKNKDKEYKNEEDYYKKRKEDILKKRYLVVDSNGNPIFIEGKRLLGMEILPIIGENGKEELDENGNILFIGPDEQTKTQDDLEPIILDTNLPLVNEENKPFLGMNGIIMVNKFGNPIVGPGELYDKYNKIVHGELGIFPIDKLGNLIKFNIPEEHEPNYGNNFNKDVNDNNSIDVKKINNEDIDNNINNNKNNYSINNDDRFKDGDNNINKNIDNYITIDDRNKNFDNKNYNKYNSNDDNENINKNKKIINQNKTLTNNQLNNNQNNNNQNYKTKSKNQKYNPKKNTNNNEPKPKSNNINKYYNSISNHNNNEKYNENKINIKPLIGSDGRPVLDNKNNPIMLDDKNRLIKGTGITILQDQSGMAVLNSEGEPILINKEGKPINFIGNGDNKTKNLKIYYLYLKKYYNNIKPNRNNKRYKIDSMNYNEETGKFNINPFFEGNKKDYVYPKPNQNYQRKLNYKPISNSNYKPKEYSSFCFACDLGCSISRSGYSPMTYSPYDNRVKRREVTPLKDE